VASGLSPSYSVCCLHFTNRRPYRRSWHHYTITVLPQLPVQQQLVYKVTLIMYKLMTTSIPAYLSELLATHSPAIPTRYSSTAYCSLHSIRLCQTTLLVHNTNSVELPTSQCPIQSTASYLQF